MMRRFVFVFFVVCSVSNQVFANEQPNILWIVVEDASPHLSCYGETTIETPNLDRLADEGVKFTNAFVTCPVCSPSRSAMVSGMFQTTLGAHAHRSQRVSGKWSAELNPYAKSYSLPEEIQLIPSLFRKAGYFVANGGTGKTDYNFTSESKLYDSKSWSDSPDGKPFFAQIHLRGGKFREAKVEGGVDPNSVQLPPYYPDSEVIRKDWAKYLNSWIQVDNEVGKIVADLAKAGKLDSTAIFFWTDHGISHARGKQFLYDEGIHVPLIARLPQAEQAGTVRDDLVLHIDVAAASLRLAEIEIPDYVQGKPIFDENYRPRRRVFAARDRCDETVDIIRCVRTKRFKYIRNFLPHISHMQPNQYKDGKEILKEMRRLHKEKKLSKVQSRIYAPRRHPEELYDLEEDPFETNNLLAGTMDEKRAYRDTANVMRLALYQWMVDSGDLGLIPEPILEELGREAGSKYAVRGPKKTSRLIWKLISTIEEKERRDQAGLLKGLNDDHPAVRWWAATGLGTMRLSKEEKQQVLDALSSSLEDPSVGVRVAAAEALCLQGETKAGLPVLTKELGAENRPAGMYAIRGLEILGKKSKPALPEIRNAQKIPYDVTRRIADRLVFTLEQNH
ncbi:sulfatase-like hydrolase/transferase [Thalassoglobus polymorphus]|uniref:Arylsulfatase n=1 Tax=Thalassoglobus polymorphus TaxID=2527994 RepID=A0A517QQ43_9PLAN|nr:sulfatase-like hydrolase/transferase [Thalassoglobus polymorphus]QDT33703.1 Arylsulfatase [Thalassoglobus polymorphus]